MLHNPKTSQTVSSSNPISSTCPLNPFEGVQSQSCAASPKPVTITKLRDELASSASATAPPKVCVQFSSPPVPSALTPASYSDAVQGVKLKTKPALPPPQLLRGSCSCLRSHPRCWRCCCGCCCLCRSTCYCLCSTSCCSSCSRVIGPHQHPD